MKTTRQKRGTRALIVLTAVFVVGAMICLALLFALPAQAGITRLPDESSSSSPSPSASPAQAANAGTDAHYQRHWDLWVPVLAQLEAAGANGTVTVDTAGQDLDHIMACVFGKLENTSRTLVVKHQGATYTIRGGADVGGKMGGILLGHNHSLALLHSLGYAR